MTVQGSRADCAYSTKMVTNVLPTALDSLSRLKKKGMSNVNRVRKSGRDLASRYGYSRFMANPFAATEHDKEIVYDPTIPENENLKLLSKMESSNDFIPNMEHHKLISRSNSANDLGSQVSLNSEAQTLVNAFSSTNSSLFKTSRQGSSPYSNPIAASSTSLFSAPTRVSSTVFNEEFKLDVVTEYQPLTKPSEEVKNLICSYNHEVAYEIGKTEHLNYYQLPFPWRENRYIIYNYRFYDSHKKSLLSIFNWYGWHNETSNIWTHLIGGLYLIYMAVYDFPRSEIFLSDKIPTTAKLIVYLFLFAAIKCLFASVFWHSFNGTCTLKLRSKFACVDYSGISILITASILTTEFVTLYSSYRAMCVYMAISLSLGIFGVFMNWSPKFDRPEARPLRIKFFVLLASMGVLSFLHLTFLTDWKYATWLLAPVTNKSIVWYCIGVVFYGSFIPERFRSDVQVDPTIPTTFQLSTDLNIITKDKNIHFRSEPVVNEEVHNCKEHWKSFKSLWWVDYVGCSHTFWHFFVVLGIIGHYRAIIDMFTKRWLLA
ncbi:hypothetical protein NCAS_0D02600 [Naumovozyma castellii]|uniref:ADIPOR-like receptor IZH3 n=1 Tax=Naumovozyma castellii TaxID=27288 RepID=G0VE50_NAUCA|nr:hypothetical protein NCAS_0D02600 [Naumovozyma castellii CBS 4309]CCC69841.1 hypothetical protein NCAS_0D02600 [Naumovozyma castellii CBS 4309]